MVWNDVLCIVYYHAYIYTYTYNIAPICTECCFAHLHKGVSVILILFHKIDWASPTIMLDEYVIWQREGSLSQCLGTHSHNVRGSLSHCEGITLTTLDCTVCCVMLFYTMQQCWAMLYCILFCKGWRSYAHLFQVHGCGICHAHVWCTKTQ